MTSSKPSGKLNEKSSAQTIDQILRSATQDLKKAGVDSPRTDVLVLMELCLKKDRTWILAHSDEKMPQKELSKLLPLLIRRQNREPLAYITGFRDFYGLKLAVSRDTLIPRPATEGLVEYAIKSSPRNGSVLDVGTGSGAIALALKSKRPDLVIYALDVSKKVLRVARDNSSRLGLNIKFVHSNMFENVHDRYDTIVANLPYLPEKRDLDPELSFEPASALLSGPDGLDHYRRLMRDALQVLKPVGIIIIEHDPHQTPQLLEICPPSTELTSVTPFVSVLRVIDTLE